MQFKISNYSWHFIRHLKKTTKSIETIILFLSTAFLHFEYDYSRGSHFANYFRIIKSLQSICTTTSTLFIKKGVQKLAAFNASTSSSSGACPSVWAASDQQTLNSLQNHQSNDTSFDNNFYGTSVAITSIHMLIWHKYWLFIPFKYFNPMDMEIRMKNSVTYSTTQLTFRNENWNGDFPKAYPGIALSQITLKVTNIRVYKITLYIAPVMRHSYCHI